MENVKEFYRRIRKSKLKYVIFKTSIIIPFVGFSSKILNFVFNDIIYGTPKPSYSDTLPPSLIYDIFNKYYIIIGIIGILVLVIIDLIFEETLT